MMKKFMIYSLLFFVSVIIKAQVPESFNYQAVIRDDAGELIINQNIGVEISILQGSESGTVVYSEQHLIKSTNSGVVNMKVGNGNNPTTDFSAIDWGANTYFIEIGIDKTGGESYTSIGAYQLISVPYALYAKNVEAFDKEVLYFPETDTLFAVKDHDGNIVFAVFPDGAKVFVNNETKGKIGGFAVTGRNPGKSLPEEDYMIITADSTRVYIPESPSGKGNVGGFAVTGRNPGKGDITSDYFNVSGVNSVDFDSINPSEARMLWYPKSEAFLVGRVLVEAPDSVGLNSVATGFESKAIGDYSQAFGFQSIARNDYSTAIGKNALANGINSFAFGENAVAYSTESYSFGRGAKSYGYRSFAFGSSGVDSSGVETGVTQAKGDYSFAIGQGSITGIDLEDCPPKPPKFLGTQEEYWKIYYSGEGAVAIGVGDSSLASYATTLGYYNTASYGSVALGYKNKSYASHSAVLGGYSNKITSSSSVIAGGYNHRIDAPYAGILGGYQNKVYSNAAWGVIGGGYRNEVYGSSSTIVNGTYNVALGDLSVVMGSGNYAYSWCETAVGQYNDSNVSGNPGEWVYTDPLFIIGNGLADNNRSNAMLVKKNGEVYFPDVFYDGVGSTNLELYIDNTGKIGTITSSKRYKKDITLIEDIDWIYKLEPVNFVYINDKTGIKQYGLIAEDVETVNKEFVSYNQNNEIETVQYSKLMTPMLKAIQDQKKEIDQLNKRIKELEAEKLENEELKQRVEKLEDLINQLVK